MGMMAVFLGVLEVARESEGHGFFTLAVGAGVLAIYGSDVVGLVSRRTRSRRLE